MSQFSTGPKRGRPAAASRDDVLDAGLYRYLRGQRVDVQAIASELGLGRATIYRWFGSREKLLGEVIIRATEPVLVEARSGFAGKGGPGLLDTFDRFNRALADAPAAPSSTRSGTPRCGSTPRAAGSCNLASSS